MKYLIKLNPRSKFFFGGDRTFTSNERQNYYSHSTFFPQQTALLGMLRYALLKENNLLETDDEVRKTELIGSSGFDAVVDSYGIIKQLSPVFIIENQDFWLSAGFDKQSYAQLRLGESKNLKIEKFNAKEILEHRFVASNSSKPIQSLSYFFTETPQVGNAKDRGGKAQQDAFFKQKYLSFQRNEANYESKFAFGIEIETDETINLGGLKTVFLGAESVFTIEILESKGIFEAIDTQNTNLKVQKAEDTKIVLLSDCYVANLAQLKSNADFILTDSPIPFKFNQSKQREYYKKPDRSDQYHLLGRGTVIYPKDTIAITEQIESESAFRSIGYNHYQIQTR